MNALEISNLTKKYATTKGQQKIALSDFSLEVKKGSIFGLLGPNGAGKSTIINIVAGTVRKTQGKVEIMDVDIDQNPKLAKTKIGVVPQEVFLDPFFTVFEALEIHAGYYGILPNKRKTDEILEALGLLDKANSTPRQLSGGMKRRFLVAKAMVHSPELLILDEPTAGVDIELRDQLWQYVRKLHQQGTTIILTTHYLEEAEELCDRIGFISNGKLVKCDTKDKLLSSLPTKELIICFESEIDDIPAKLKKYEIDILSKKKLKIKYNKKVIHLSQIIEDIKSSKLAIADLSTNEASLEDIFRLVYTRN